MSKEPQSQRNISQDESSIIAAVCHGDRRLFHDLIRPYENSAYRLAFHLLRDETSAEDAVLSAFLRAFHSLSDFRVESKFSTWLMSITLNEVIARLNKKKGLLLNSIDVETEGGTPFNCACRIGMPVSTLGFQVSILNRLMSITGDSKDRHF